MADDELSADDTLALGWAVLGGHSIGPDLAERLRSGEAPLGADDVATVRRDWEAAGRPVVVSHTHRGPVTFIDGTSVLAVSFVQDDPYARDAVPSFGLYLDDRWAPPWPHAHIDWPDFGVPADVDQLRAALVSLLDRARAGETVEIGCLGAHGRTGTALACLAILTETAPPADAVAWVRANHCERAVETDEQSAFVASFGR